MTITLRQALFLPEAGFMNVQYNFVEVSGRNVESSQTCRFTLCPASPEKEDQRAAGSPAALTQLSSLGRYVFGSEISYNKAPPRLPGLGC